LCYDGSGNLIAGTFFGYLEHARIDGLTKEQQVASFADKSDVNDIDRIFDLLGNTEGIGELPRFSNGIPVPMRHDIAVALGSARPRTWNRMRATLPPAGCIRTGHD